MPPCTASTALLKCSFGMAPSSLEALPTPRVLIEGKPAANIMTKIPFVNVLPFGMCTSLSNPTVAAATAAAMGTLTPMPCTPVLPAPWVPTLPTVQVGGEPVLLANSNTMCAYAGVITIALPGTTTVEAG